MRAVILSFVACFVGVLPPSARAEEATGTFGPDAHAALGAFRGMVEEHIEGIVRTLRVVADTKEVKSANWEDMKPLVVRVGDDLPTDATTWFAIPDGSYYASQTAEMTDRNLKDRPYFPNLMAGKEVLGDLVISKSTGHRSVIVAVPVRSGDKTVGALGVSLRVRLLSELVDKDMRLPSNSYFYALERDTRIVLHRKADRMFQTPTDIGDEALGEEFKRELQRDRGSFEYTLEGKKIAAIFELSPTLGWYFFLAREI